MPRYRFTGFFETVLHGLAHGVNATLHRAGEDGEPLEHDQPEGSTVVAQPGDEIETDETYPHAHMVNIDTGEPDEPQEAEAALGDRVQINVPYNDPATERRAGRAPATGAERTAAGLLQVQTAGRAGAEGIQVLTEAAAAAATPDNPATAPPAGNLQAAAEIEQPPTDPATDSSSSPADPDVKE